MVALLNQEELEPPEAQSAPEAVRREHQADNDDDDDNELDGRNRGKTRIPIDVTLLGFGKNGCMIRSDITTGKVVVDAITMLQATPVASCSSKYIINILEPHNLSPVTTSNSTKICDMTCTLDLLIGKANEVELDVRCGLKLNRKITNPLKLWNDVTGGSRTKSKRHALIGFRNQVPQLMGQGFASLINCLSLLVALFVILSSNPDASEYFAASSASASSLSISTTTFSPTTISKSHSKSSPITSTHFRFRDEPSSRPILSPNLYNSKLKQKQYHPTVQMLAKHQSKVQAKQLSSSIPSDGYRSSDQHNDDYNDEDNSSLVVGTRVKISTNQVNRQTEHRIMQPEINRNRTGNSTIVIKSADLVLGFHQLSSSLTRTKRSQDDYFESTTQSQTSIIDSSGQIGMAGGSLDDDSNTNYNITTTTSAQIKSTFTSTKTFTRFATSRPNEIDGENNHDKMIRLVDVLKQKYLFNRALSNQAYYLVMFIYIVFTIFGTLSNSIICLTVVLKPRILSPRNIFILNLASSDLLLCIFTMPFSFIEISTKTWPMGELPCKLVSSLQATSIFVSTISITAIALDRYRVIVYSTHQDSSGRMNGLTGAIILLSVWCAALILSLPLFLTRQLKTEKLPGTLYEVLGREELHFCIEEWPFDHGRGIYSVFSMFIQYVVPITIVSIVYVKISDKLQKRLIRRQRLTQLECQHKRQLQLINRTHNMLITVSLVFGLCWLPLNLLNVIVDFTAFLTKDEKMFRTVFAICHLIGSFSACSNPVLYGYMNENFRKEIIQVYTQQWQKILRYMCRFRANSRSTRRTMATNTTTTTTTEHSSSDSESNCSTTRSSISSSSSSSTCSSYDSTRSSSVSSKHRSVLASSSTTGSGRKHTSSSFSEQEQTNRLINNRVSNLNKANNKQQSMSHTAIDIALCSNELMGCESLSSHRDHLSTSCTGGIQENENSSLTGAKPSLNDKSKSLRAKQLHCHSNQHVNINNNNNNNSSSAGGWLERVLVRSVWFMGSVSSCGALDKPEADVKPDISDCDPKALPRTSLANTDNSKTIRCKSKKNKNANCDTDKKEVVSTNQHHLRCNSDKCASFTDLPGHRPKITTTYDNYSENNRIHQRDRLIKSSNSSSSKKRKVDKHNNNNSTNKRLPKTKCVCHCHNKPTNGRYDNTDNKTNYNNNNSKNRLINNDELQPDADILRTCSTGARPHCADILTAQIRLAKANLEQQANKNDQLIPNGKPGCIESDENLTLVDQRRRSSTDARANCLYKLKTISTNQGGGDASKKHTSQRLDPMTQPMGQRVWLRFFPSMQRYCFNQTTQANGNNNNGVLTSLNPKNTSLDLANGRTINKPHRHCYICRPSAERRRKERREQRQLRRLAKREAKMAIASSKRIIQTMEYNKNEHLEQQHQAKKADQAASGNELNQMVDADRTNLDYPQSTSSDIKNYATSRISSDTLNTNQQNQSHNQTGGSGGRQISAYNNEIVHPSNNCDNSDATATSCHFSACTVNGANNKSVCSNIATTCPQSNCPEAANGCTIDSTNESEICRKESLDSYGSKSWAATSLSSSYSCIQSSYSTCSCLANSSNQCNGSLACIESIISVSEKNQTDSEQDPKL